MGDMLVQLTMQGLQYLFCAHVQGVNQSVLSLIVIMETKSPKSGDL